jgi:hypothetical protein
MSTEHSLATAAKRAELTTLAQQLRDGPLQQLLELQAQLAALTRSFTGSQACRVDEIERLVRMSLTAMQHFNAFTREFATILRELTDAHEQRH